MVRSNVLITLCHGGRARTGEGGREKGRVCLVAALLEAEEGLAVQLAILARALLVDQAAECIVLRQRRAGEHMLLANSLLCHAHTKTTQWVHADQQQKAVGAGSQAGR